MKRVLFVDDESLILDGIRRSLRGERDRWDMRFAVGGEAALQACEIEHFDVVVTDMRMPGMDGATLLGHIRDRFPHAVRVVLSGYSEMKLATRAVSVAHRSLSKPCNPTELQSTIERLIALQDLICAPEIRRIVGAVGELPSLSTTFGSLSEAVRDPNTSINQIASIVEQDVAMSAKVLQLANSAFFGLSRQATSLFAAVSALGMETIKNLALTSDAFRAFSPTSLAQQAVCDDIQRHSVRVAAIAGVLPVDREVHDISVVAALLHDIGKLFLATVMPADFRKITSRAAELGCTTVVAEEELLGTTHAEIGAYLLGLWGIPTLAVEAIAHHHHPTRIAHSGMDCTVAVYLADLLAHELEDHPEGPNETQLGDADRACLEKLGVMPRMAEFRELACAKRG